MRHIILAFGLLLPLLTFAQEEIEYKEYSYTEFFQMIEEESDTVFRLENAVIRFNEQTDQRFKVAIRAVNSKDSTFQRRNDIIVHKRLELENVIFKKDLITENGRPFVAGAIYDIHFKKDVILLNTSNLFISYSIFDGILEYTLQDCSAFKDIVEVFNLFYVEFSTFSEFDFYKFCQGQSYSFGVYLNGNTIESADPKGSSSISNYENSILSLTNNHIKAQNYLSIRNHRGAGTFEFKNNDLEGSLILLEDQNTQGNLLWSNNSFSNPINLAISALGVNDEVEWSQFKDQVKSLNAFADFTQEYNGRFPIQQPMEYRAKLDSLYYDSVRYHNENIFAKEIGLKGNFYTYYKNKYNTAVANEVYLELKDFETERLKVLYEQNKTFDSFFKWKINQFLKLFAAYGTEPARAITMSVYVILIFALIYLFFPNHWDSHGKNRIMDRYRFFLKYVNRDSGIHEVYLEEQKQDLLNAEDFKTYLLEQGKTAPKFFMATALPLYKWAISGTKLTASFLSRVDVMKGTWSELPQSKRVWKSVLLISAFLIALTYDIFIKMLNALMLSINTFTTLGFGEIPIKGLPRYLAIIQGFIGWFMLTIFSVSLISQLLN